MAAMGRVGNWNQPEWSEFSCVICMSPVGLQVNVERETEMMKQLAADAILAGAIAGTAYAQEPSSTTTTTPPRTITTTPDTSTTTGLAAPIQSEVLSTIPSSATTVT